MEQLRQRVIHGQADGFLEKNMIRVANDVAETTQSIFDRINWYLGLTKNHYFDVTFLKPHFEKRKDYDAETAQYPPDLAFNNFPRTKSKLHMERMTCKFLDEG